MGGREERRRESCLSSRTCHCSEPDSRPLGQRRLPQGRWSPSSRPTPAAPSQSDCLFPSQVYWRHAAGDLDRYLVVIRFNLTVLQNQSVSAGQNECVFSSLTPGRLYTVTVETWSGGSVSSISTDGRTCERDGRVGRVGLCSRALTWPTVCPFSPSCCEEPVARRRRHRPPDGQLEPRPRRRGPLRGA